MLREIKKQSSYLKTENIPRSKREVYKREFYCNISFKILIKLANTTRKPIHTHSPFLNTTTHTCIFLVAWRIKKGTTIDPILLYHIGYCLSTAEIILFQKFPHHPCIIPSGMKHSKNI